MQRLGFFGGCFNPPTIAHYKLALKAIESANLDKLYFVPMGDYYPKEDLISAEDRYKMLSDMVQENSKLEVSRIQMDQKKSLQAIDTFRLIDQEFPSSEKFFIMGSDNFEKIDKWKESKELINSYNYIILSRNNFKNDNVIVVNDDETLKDISSSLVRTKLNKNENIDDLVTKEVKEYILEKNLYK